MTNTYTNTAETEQELDEKLATETDEEIEEALASIREAIDEECISYGEIFYLQEHQDYIKKHSDDVVLWEWANIPEEEWNGHNTADED
jgi:hypothetical protein